MLDRFAGCVPRTELGEAGLKRIIAGGGTAEAQASITYWGPKVAASFGDLDSGRFDPLRRIGLRRTPNAALYDRWHADILERLAPHGLHLSRLDPVAVRSGDGGTPPPRRT